MKNCRDANTRTRYHFRLMGNVSVLFDFSNLLGRAMPQKFCVLTHVLHYATDRQQRILSIYNTARAAGFRFVEMNLPLEYV